MKRILAFSLTFCIVGTLFAASKVITNTKWGEIPELASVLYNGRIPNFNQEKFDGADQFGVVDELVNLKEVCSDTSCHHTGDNTIAFVAQKIVDNGGCFIPVDIFCKHENADRYDATIAYYTPDNSYSTECTWLCADGYMGKDCKLRGDTYSGSTVNWWGLDKTKRDALRTVGNKANKKGGQAGKMITKDEIDVDVFAAQKLNMPTPADASIVLGITNYYNSAVEAAPVVIKCNGSRIGLGHFHGIGRYRKIVGDKKLLCPSGYVPNPNDSESCILYQEQSRTGSSTTQTPDDDTSSTGTTGSNSSVTNVKTGYTDKLTRAELAYGRGKDVDITDPNACWTKTNSTEYKKCVLGK